MSPFRPHVVLLIVLLLAVLEFGAAAETAEAEKANTKADVKPADLAQTECLAQQTELDEHKKVLGETKEDREKLLTEVLILRDEYALLVTKLGDERTKTEQLSGSLEDVKKEKEKANEVTS
jgi:hypothetical protein